MDVDALNVATNCLYALYGVDCVLNQTKRFVAPVDAERFILVMIGFNFADPPNTWAQAIIKLVLGLDISAARCLCLRPFFSRKTAHLEVSAELSHENGGP